MKNLEKLKTLHTILGTNNFILTGTTALAYHGLLDFSEAKDLDILLINPSDGAKEVLSNLQKANPSPKFKEGGSVTHSFFYEGVKVDVWILASHEDTEYIQTKEGIKLASIRWIVKAKEMIGRSKDWIQLMQLSRKIFDQNKFNNQLPQITNHSEDYNLQED